MSGKPTFEDLSAFVDGEQADMSGSVRPDMVSDAETAALLAEIGSVDSLVRAHYRGEAAAMSQMALKDVTAQIGRLPEEQRVILLLVVAEGWRYRDVAEILDLPIGTVTSRLARARDTLRQCLEGTAP